MLRFLIFSTLLAACLSQPYPRYSHQPPSYPGPRVGAPGQAAPVYARLTPEQQELLARGEITGTEYILGGVIGSYLGFGIGHAIQGRYGRDGVKFTIGQSATITLIIIGALSCIDHHYDADYYDSPEYADTAARNRNRCHEYALWAGITGYFAFRIWEAVDVWSAPPEHNRRVRWLRHQLATGRIGFAVRPNEEKGATASLTLRF